MPNAAMAQCKAQATLKAPLRPASLLGCRQRIRPYEQKPWQRAFRRARMLRQRLGSSTGRDGALDGASEKPDGMSVDDYARLLDEILQAETQAYQARAEWTQRFVARIVERSKPPFTL